jgi:4-amino-4-deoxychorismate lyase
MRPRLRAEDGARDEDRGGAVELLRFWRHQRNARVPALPLILVDGVATDTVSALDRGLALGDGVFRTLRVRAGRPLNWRWHWTRLVADCARLRLPLPDEATLRSEVARVASHEAVVKAIITRGAAGRGYAMPADARATRIVSAHPVPPHPAEWTTAGVRVRRCHLVLAQQPRLAGAKTLNRLENVLARSEWDDPAIAEGLVADAEGRVIEGTASNLFIAAGGRVFTPDLARCGVIGAQRERVRELLGAERVHCEERDLRWTDVLAATEIFLTNSVIGVWPVRQVDERQYAPGPIAARLRELVERDDAAP